MKIGDTVVLRDGSKGRFWRVTTAPDGYTMFWIDPDLDSSKGISFYDVDWPATEAANEEED